VPEVIADTSPLQYLYQADCLDLLSALYGSVGVPEGVVREIEVGHALGVSLPTVGELPWMWIVPVPEQPLLPLVADLGPGEREVLALTVGKPETLALLDDRLARDYARFLGISFTGTLGVLLRAKTDGHLDAVGPKVARLEELGFRVTPATRDAVLDLAGELKRRR